MDFSCRVWAELREWNSEVPVELLLDGNYFVVIGSGFCSMDFSCRDRVGFLIDFEWNFQVWVVLSVDGNYFVVLGSRYG